MADEKQLTVAELLARNQKDRSGGEKSSRRRRRSLEEGGISVAELTGNLEKVKATPAEAKHSNVSIDETAPVIPAPQKDAEKTESEPKTEPEPQADAVRVERPDQVDSDPKRSQPSTEDTRVIQRVKDTPEKKTDTEVEEKAHTKTEDKTGDKTEDTFTTGELEAVDHDVEEYDEYDEDYEEEKLNPFAVVVLALVGIVLGAIVFKGFEILWDRFDRLVVVVLGVVVTGVIVGIVHALRTSRDGLSMFLAAVAGLVLTFGPLLVVM